MWFLLLNFVAVLSLVASDHHIDCGPPEVVEHTHVRHLTRMSETTVGAVIQYECNAPLWVLHGQDNGIYTCSESGNWTNRLLKEGLPHCVKVSECGEPHAIQHGHVDHLTDHLENDYLSVIKYSCDADYREEQYSDEGIYVCTEHGHWVNKDLGEKLPICIPVHCGEAMTHVEEADTDHAKPVTHGAAPWTVLLQRENDTDDLRNGVLIGHRWVLTSAHNFHSHEPRAAAAEFTAHVGVEDAADLRTGHSYHVEGVFFEAALPTPEDEEYRNDLVLLKLAEPVLFGDHAVPICLPAVHHAAAGLHGAVAGWDLDHEGGAHHLTYAALPVAPKAECARHFADSHPGLFPLDLPEQFCTHAVEHRADAAQRDKGAVFQAEVDGTAYAVGVLAHDDPGEGHDLAVFTDVFDHVNWIKGIMSTH